jgi:hypothetical protein
MQPNLNLKPKREVRASQCKALRFALVFIISCAWLLHCKGEETGARLKVPTPNTIVRDGFEIELLGSPEAQLRYALARFDDPRAKKASLEVVIDQFPHDQAVRAAAEMELAYLILGADYRFATQGQCHRAIEAYRRVLVDHAELPAVCAKANWYIGWILAELLEAPREAATYFLTIVDTYPDAKQSLIPPVPWVSLVLPQSEDRPQTVYDRPTHFWGSLALLEMIRLGETDGEKWAAFRRLHTRYPRSLATAYAMRELLMGSPALARKTVPYAKTHLKAMYFRRPLADEIPKLIERIAAADKAQLSGESRRGEGQTW